MVNCWCSLDWIFNLATCPRTHLHRYLTKRGMYFVPKDGGGEGRGGKRWVTTKFGSSDAPLDQTKRQTIGRQVSDHWWISFWGHKSSQIKTRFRFQKLLQKFKHTISLRNLQSIHGSEVEACSYWKKPRVSVVFVAFKQFMSFLSSLQELTRNDSCKHCHK